MGLRMRIVDMLAAGLLLWRWVFGRVVSRRTLKVDWLLVLLVIGAHFDRFLNGTGVCKTEVFVVVAG